jgi:hypothetical protein
MTDTEKLILELLGVENPTEETLLDMAEKADMTPEELIKIGAILVKYREERQ